MPAGSYTGCSKRGLSTGLCNRGQTDRGAGPHQAFVTLEDLGRSRPVDLTLSAPRKASRMPVSPGRIKVSKKGIGRPDRGSAPISGLQRSSRWGRCLRADPERPMLATSPESESAFPNAERGVLRPPVRVMDQSRSRRTDGDRHRQGAGDDLGLKIFPHAISPPRGGCRDRAPSPGRASPLRCARARCRPATAGRADRPGSYLGQGPAPPAVPGRGG